MRDKKKVPGKPTIYDIAKASGVSPGTVSRTLNNIGYIKDETRQKVEKVVHDLKYIPNRAARTLKTKKTGLIMLAIPDTGNPFYVDIIKAVQRVVKLNDYSMILFFTEDNRSEEIKALKMMHEHFADALILINFKFTKEHHKEIQRINCPLVLSGIGVDNIGGHDEDRFDYIGVDTAQGMYIATNHLIMQGHTEIGYIGGLKEAETFSERYNGYRRALTDSNIRVKDELLYWREYSKNTGYDAGKYFLSLSNMPTAVCAANDLLAIGVIRSFEENGVRVPEDVAVIGMDNIDLASQLKPKLSTVYIAQYEIGSTAAELIFKRLNGEEQGTSKQIIFEPRLVVRDSSIIKS